MSNYRIESLGVAGYGNAWLGFRYARDPKSGVEMILGCLSKGGFLLFDPRVPRTICVGNDWPDTEVWAAGQAPDGSFYAAHFGKLNQADPPGPGYLLHWNWEGTKARPVGRLPGASFFSLDVAADGTVCLPDYKENCLFTFDPRTASFHKAISFAATGDHVRGIACALDGWIYVLSTHQPQPSKLVACDGVSGRQHVVELPPGFSAGFFKDARGRVLLRGHQGQSGFARELQAGKVGPAFAFPAAMAGAYLLPFSDGSAVRINDRECIWDDNNRATYIDAAGQEHPLTVPRPELPLRIFSVASGAGRVWCGTFIPLELISWQADTGQFVNHGNPNRSTGEIYGMAYSADKLFTASYTSAAVARFDPRRPWHKGDQPQDNPRHLGYMKEDGPQLHRPYGQAMDEQGNVFFAALGDYGCLDSGVCRIEPKSEAMTRWLYRDTFIGPMTYVRQTSQLLVSERRQGEEGIRFTLLCPKTGAVQWSELMIRDGGDVHSWLDSGGDLIYGMHAWRATLFAFSLSKRQIVASLPELRFGEHCHNALIHGPDGRIWGLTNQAVFAADPQLQGAQEVVGYRGDAYPNAYRFGFCYGPDGALYFPNGPQLMRITAKA